MDSKSHSQGGWSASFRDSDVALNDCLMRLVGRSNGRFAISWSEFLLRERPLALLLIAVSFARPGRSIFNL